MMVVIGGITRLTHSGLSMVEWNMIVGSLPPSTDAEWQVPFEKYKQTPEYKLINNQFSLEEFKSIFWWEYIHRLLGRVIGVVFIVPFIYFALKKRFDSVLMPKMVILLFLGAFQGFLGWYMVKSGLQKDPNVSHYRLAAHLISAFTVFGFTFWYALDLIYPNKKTISTSIQKLLGFARIMFGLLVVQIIYGAFVAGLKAGLFYNTFPKMGEEFFPETIFAYDTFWQNMLENIAGVQFVHRYLAYVVVGAVVFVWLKARKENLFAFQQRAANILLGVVGVQFLLGVFTILYAVPISLGVLHQMGAFVLYAAALYFIKTLKVEPLA